MDELLAEVDGLVAVEEMNAIPDAGTGVISGGVPAKKPVSQMEEEEEEERVPQKRQLVAA